MPRLTDLAIRALPIPEKGQVIHLDDQPKGFGVRVSPGGTKTFVLTYGADRKRVSLGRYGIISLAQAREQARKHLQSITLGTRPPVIGLKSLVARFLEEKRRNTRPATHASYKRLLERHMDFDADITTITPHRLSEIFDTLYETPQERSHLIVVTKILFSFAQSLHYIDRNPVDGFKAKAPTPRERILSIDELKAVWGACGDDVFGKTVKLALLTGQRAREIQHITIDGDLASIAAFHTKNKRQHTFPVGETAQSLLGSNLAFNGWSKAKSRLDKQSGITGYTLHDCRRTHATLHASIGTPPHIIEALLNHKSGIISGVASTYNRYQYLPEMRLAVSNFEKYITQVLELPE